MADTPYGDILYAGSFQTAALILADGSITDTSGAISFGNDNLTTTGTATANTLNAADPETGVQLNAASVFRMKGTSNMFIGPASSLNYAGITGTNNIVVGSYQYQYYQLTSGANNTAIGAQALQAVTTG